VKDNLNMIKIKSNRKSNLFSTRLNTLSGDRINGFHLHGFAPGFTLQVDSDGELLALCRSFDQLGI